jgi:hypothetical protein
MVENNLYNKYYSESKNESDYIILSAKSAL